jgi:hypothetical protein
MHYLYIVTVKIGQQEKINSAGFFGSTRMRNNIRDFRGHKIFITLRKDKQLLKIIKMAFYITIEIHHRIDF